MPIRLECESCSTRVKVPDGTAGRRVRCPNCGKVQVIGQRAPKRETVVHAAARANGDARATAVAERPTRTRSSRRSVSASEFEDQVAQDDSLEVASSNPADAAKAPIGEFAVSSSAGAVCDDATTHETDAAACPEQESDASPVCSSSQRADNESDDAVAEAETEDIDDVEDEEAVDETEGEEIEDVADDEEYEDEEECEEDDAGDGDDQVRDEGLADVEHQEVVVADNAATEACRDHEAGPPAEDAVSEPDEEFATTPACAPADDRDQSERPANDSASSIQQRLAAVPVRRSAISLGSSSSAAESTAEAPAGTMTSDLVETRATVQPAGQPVNADPSGPAMLIYLCWALRVLAVLSVGAVVKLSLLMADWGADFADIVFTLPLGLGLVGAIWGVGEIARHMHGDSSRRP